MVVDDPVMFTKPWVMDPEKTTLANPDDYIQPEMCKTNDKAHLILATPDNRSKCNWCQVDADKVYGQGAARKTRRMLPRGSRGGGGGE